MVSPEHARRLALAFPEAGEQDHHGFPSFRVRGKIFATAPDPGHLHVMLDEVAIREAVALAPDACEEKWWGKKLSALRVALAEVDEEALAALLKEAWKRRAPKKLAKENP